MLSHLFYYHGGWIFTFSHHYLNYFIARLMDKQATFRTPPVRSMVFISRVALLSTFVCGMIGCLSHNSEKDRAQFFEVSNSLPYQFE